MTIYEVSKKYCIPIELLKEYESWKLYKTKKKEIGKWQYDEQDIEKLSMIMTLYDAGFCNQEIKQYMLLSLHTDTKEKRISMLNQKRSNTLEEIHKREKQIEYLDYIKYEIQKT